MTSASTNAFGENLPLDDPAAVCAALGIKDGDRVLEVGGAGNPLERANVICDLTFGSCAQRNGAPGVFRDDVTYVEAACEELPFADGEFDFVYCTQVLEHVKDPAAACRELSRVAPRGFVEVPSRLGEMINGNPTHRWVVDREGDTLVFCPRNFVEHPLRNFFYGTLFQDEDLKRLSEIDYRNLFNHQVLFEGTLSCRVDERRADDFDYDDPAQAGRAHYSFARNTLAAGAEASYAYPDAVEATRLLPDSVAARWLLAVYQAHLLRPDDALETLGDTEGAEVAALRRLIGELAAGRPLDPRALPLPGADPGGAAQGGIDPRPLVSVIVAGHDAEEVRTAAESALTQDYPDVEVVVAASCPLEPALDRLRMGERLVPVEAPKGTGIGALLNQGCLRARGELVAFLLAPERFQAHHLDRLVATLVGGGHPAVHGDRLQLTGEGVVGPDVAPVSPATRGCSLSTVLARRAWLHELGAFAEHEGDSAPLEYMVRMARAQGLFHVREASVEGTGPLDEGVEALEQTRALAGLRPLELMRSLITAFVREQGLRARITELEGQLAKHGRQELESS